MTIQKFKFILNNRHYFTTNSIVTEVDKKILNKTILVLKITELLLDEMSIEEKNMKRLIFQRRDGLQ